MSDLTDRLRGIYTIPVNDGAGLLNGKDTFTRKFKTTPIRHEAAKEIESLQSLVRELAGALLDRSIPDMNGRPCWCHYTPCRGARCDRDRALLASIPQHLRKPEGK